jgi:aspartyl-tRNA(Asn)/glutamyl-tRNA(Gln) amidotransferase subunit B
MPLTKQPPALAGGCLVPVIIIDENFKAQIKPELPEAKKQRFKADYGLDDESVGILTASRQLADYFE